LNYNRKLIPKMKDRHSKKKASQRQNRYLTLHYKTSGRKKFI